MCFVRMPVSVMICGRKLWMQFNNKKVYVFHLLNGISNKLWLTPSAIMNPNDGCLNFKTLQN